MLDKIKDFVSNNVSKVLVAPTALTGATFLSNVVQSLSDGSITHKVLQELISSASFVDTLLLVAVLIVLKLKEK